MRERAVIYREVLRLARRRVDEARWRYDRERTAVEAAHLALIPPLLACADERRHRHYLELDRPRFIRACGRERAVEFETFWAELSALMPPTPEGDSPIPFATAASPLPLGYEARGTGGSAWASRAGRGR